MSSVFEKNDISIKNLNSESISKINHEFSSSDLQKSWKKLIKEKSKLGEKNIASILRLGKPLLKDINLINFVEDRPGHDQRYGIDASKICNKLGWSPLLSFEESLTITVKWYLDNIKWCKYMQDKSGYRGERIGIKQKQ